ncbi:hypothetical protein AFCDBAGC_2357 [Methylobacterium cerastii]|uniref:Uncharacterized protein n=1 Tax=Methylobacterium cerastii TaxID=932741 RepID=A0ABQ4QGY7_9HYPH|nr:MULTISPECIES: hypothetical protein [Methylobacterium]TXM93216.1 hypothetical protein FV219_19615 [Methylobacterium sp. WL122]TXN83509.1 hypothetical protein FV234_06040 [Methylobacterium sp. WL8]GJD44490.1 hypothetical protein AFCDBAGC_2357 [Methylobacterium cerastii]
MSALVAARHDPAFTTADRALCDQTKPAKLDLRAVARRIIVTANAHSRDSYTSTTNWGDDGEDVKAKTRRA